MVAASFAAITCSLFTSPDSSGSGGLSVNYLGDTVLVVGASIALEVSVTDGGVEVEGAQVRLTSSDSAIVRVVDVGTGVDSILPQKRGSARVRATLVGSTLGDNPPFAEVSIRGVAAFVAIEDSTSVTFQDVGDTLTLRVTLSDTNGVAIDSVADGWISSDPARVQVDNRGKLLATANTATGLPVAIRAIADRDTAVINVTVRQRLVRYQYSTPTLTITSLNQDTVVTVTPLDGNGNPIPPTTPGLPAPAFTSLNTGVATVTGLSSTQFRVSSLANDTTRVRIVAGTVDTTMQVTVGQVATSVVIQGPPADTVFALQDTVRLRARAFDARNIEVQSRPIIWTSLNTAVVTVSATGLVTGQTLNSAQVTARLDAATDARTVVVRNVPTSIQSSANVALPTIGDSALVAFSVFNRLGAAMAGVPVAWRALDPTIAQVDAALGVVVGVGIGRTSVIGQIAGGAADTTIVNVDNQIATVNITQPDTALQSIGDTMTVAVDFRNARGAAVPRSAASWRSTQPLVASVSNGFVTALQAGFTTIYAEDPLNLARFDSVRITVTNAPNQLTLNRVLDTLTAPSRTLQYVADVRNARGALIQNPLVTFRSTNGSVASVTVSGLATALAVGTTSIIAEAGTTGVGPGVRADTATLVVTNDAVALAVSPTDVTIPSVGATTQLVADARNVVGGSVTGVSFTWTTSDPSVATVNGTGQVLGVGIGSAVITAHLTTLTASSNVAVTNAPDTINIGPTAVTLASVDDSVIPAVTLRNALGATLPRGAAQWLSDDAAVAQVTADGIVIAAGRGVTRIRARNPINTSRQDSLTVTVTNAPDSINVVRTLDSLPSLNRTIQYTADVFNARRRLLVNEPVSWAVRNGSVASIASTGLATSVGIGQTFVVGTAGAERDSASLVVTNRAANVVISPAAANLSSVGQTTTLTAVARNELGNVITNPTVTWQSGNAAVVQVAAGTSANNLITATGTGTTTVSATVDGLANAITVNVNNPPATLNITSGDTTLASVLDSYTPGTDFRNSLGVLLPASSATWTSSNVNVATVNAAGLVTAVGAGVAVIRATSPVNGALTDAINVTVSNAPQTITLNTTNNTLTAVGRTLPYTAVVRNARGDVIVNAVVTWSINPAAPAIATIDAQTGVANAVGVGGPVTVRGTASNGLFTTASLTVTNNAVVLTLAPDTVTVLDLNATTQLTAVARNDLNNLLPVAAIIFGTLDPTRATVNGAGLVTTTANPANTGVARITATVNAGAATLVDTAFVTVVNAPRTINIVPANRTLASVADTAFPQTTIQNAGGTTLARTAVQWHSSAPNVASVSNDGIVTALAPGATTISATSPYDPSLTDSYAVTVTNAPASVVLNQTNVTLSALGRTTTFSAVVRNARGDVIPGATVTWSGGGGAVSIDAISGIAVANVVTAGVTITATAAGGITANATVVVTNNAASISVSPSSVALTSLAGTQLLTISVLNDLGNAIAGAPVSVVSNDLAVATITGTTVNAAGVGATTVTVTSSTVSASVAVSVTDAAVPASITLDRQALTITALGADSTVTPTVRNSVGQTLAGAALTWTSNPGGIVTVAPGGVVAGARTVSGAAVGITTVTVTTSNGIAATLPVTVRNDVASVNITTVGTQAAPAFVPTSDSLLAGITLQNSEGAAITDRRAVLWTTSNAAVAAVADSGMIFGVGSGTAIIRAVSPNSTSARDSIFVRVAALHHFEVEASGGGAIGPQAADTPFNIRITAHDASHAPVTNFAGTVVLTSSGTLVGAPVTTTSFSAGVLTTSVQVTNVGGNTITATLTGGTKTGTSGFFNVAAGATVAFNVRAFPGGAPVIPTQQVGVAFDVLLQAVDAFGQITSFTGTVDVTAINGATITGQPIPSANFSGGILVHSITLAPGSNGAGRAIHVIRTGGTETGTSLTFTVTP